MLDSFLEVAMGHEKVASDQRKLVDAMTQLPVEDLVKIASGGTKLSFLCGDSGEWLEKFKGTPLMEQAIAIEEADLERQMARNEMNRESSETWKQDDAQRDELSVRRRMLDLEFAKAEAGIGGEPEPGMEGVEEEAPPEGVEEPPVEEPPVEEAPVEEPPAEVEGAKEAATLREVEEGTVKKMRTAGGKAGAKAGRRSGGTRGGGYAALGGAAAGAVKGVKKGKGGLKGRALSAAGGALLGGAAGTAVGAGVGHVKGKKKGKAIGEHVGKHINVRRRQYLRDRMRQATQGQETKKASSAEDQLKMAESMGRELARADFEKKAAINIPGYLGARKAEAAGGSIPEGSVRGTAGAGVGGMAGGAGGAVLGGRLGGGKGALIGGGLGALAGGIGGYKALTRKFRKPAPAAEKAASINLDLAAAKMKLASGVNYDDLTDLEKAAYGPLAQGLKAGVTGIGKFLGKAAPRLATAAQKGGAKGALTAAGRVGKEGLQRATRFTRTNPLAGLTMAGTGGAMAT